MSVQKITQFQKQLAAANLDGFIVTAMPQIRYLTGFSGSYGMLVVTQKTADFYSDSRYTLQAQKEVKGARKFLLKGLRHSVLKEEKYQQRNFRFGFSDSTLTVAELKLFKEALPNALLVAANDLVEELGWVKDREEIEYITKAVDIADTALERVMQLIAPGVRERELAAELEYQMVMLGAEKAAFESIVASGYRSAMPHGVASDKKIKKGEFVTFDYGALVNGYCSDITRTFVVGKATPRQKKIYNIVLRSHNAGVRKIKPGVACSAIDKACRDIIDRAGYGKQFGHGTGHGIGLEVHSGPRLGPKTPGKLKAGNIVTVEPGIYIEKWGGVRIEDDVLVTRSGHKALSRTSKKLLEL